MVKLSVRYIAEMANGEYLFTMYDDTGYSAFTVMDFADANFYESPYDSFLVDDLKNIQSGKYRFEMGSPEFKRVVKVEMKIR